MEFIYLLFYFLIFIAAYLYSTVGHGGASGYLALMALFAFETEVMKATALTMNLFVAGIAFFVGYKSGYFRPKLLLPFILGSMPLAFIGANIDIEPRVYKISLGIFLLFASTRILFQAEKKLNTTKIAPWYLLTIIGAILGFFSGMIGIGGGIILSPIMLIFHWAKLKEVSAIAAAFIFLNSASGLAGLLLSGFSVDNNIYMLVGIGIVGAILGAYSSTKLFSGKTIQYILSVVLFSASIKMIFFA